MRYLLAALFFMTALTSKAQDTPTLTKATIEAEFPGGRPAWTQFLNKNLQYPDAAINKEIQGDVIVQFQIDEQGNVSDVKVLSGPKKGGLREEAIRMIRISGKWKPAIRNEKEVKAIKKETISFRLSVG